MRGVRSVPNCSTPRRRRASARRSTVRRRNWGLAHLGRADRGSGKTDCLFRPSRLFTCRRRSDCGGCAGSSFRNTAVANYRGSGNGAVLGQRHRQRDPSSRGPALRRSAGLPDRHSLVPVITRENRLAVRAEYDSALGFGLFAESVAALALVLSLSEFVRRG